MSYKLMIIRGDEAKRTEVDTYLPADWRVMYVGQKIMKDVHGPFNTIICACELYTDKEWIWYHTLVQNLSENKSKKPIWTT